MKLISVDEYYLEYVDPHQKKTDNIALEQAKSIIYEYQKIKNYNFIIGS